jgi:plastocyanin
MRLRTSPALLILLVACGGSSGEPPDAAAPVDAVPATVVTVACPTAAVPTITASDGNDTSYMPRSVTIGVGEIVKFTMPRSHNVVPNTLGTSDPGLKVNYGETRCLMFTAAGTFGFYCSPHGFSGTVIVQ